MEKISIIKNGRKTISTFLTTMFRYEGYGTTEELFSFDQKKEEDLQEIKFRNADEALMGYQLLNWHYDSSPEGPVIEGSSIMVNFFSLDILRNKKRPSYLFFVLPPLKGSGEIEIKKRGRKIMTGYEPKVQILSDDEFMMTYPTAKTNEKIFNFIVEMGWEAKMENNSIISKFRTFGAITMPSVETTPAVTVIQKTEEPKVETKAKVMATTNVTITPIAIKQLFNRDEAVIKFQYLYEDDNLWPKVSPENQSKVTNVLRNHYKSGSLEAFVMSLVNTGKIGLLWTEEERVLELNKVVSNYQFTELPEWLQKEALNILKSHLGDVDPDALVSGLLELF